MGRAAWVYGWGRLGDGLPLSNVLMETKGRVITRRICQRKWGIWNGRNPVMGFQLCVEHPAGKGDCNGDSGGPVTRAGPDNRHILIGVSSFGALVCGVKFSSALQVYFIELSFSGSRQTRSPHKCGILQGLDRQGTKRKSRILSAINEIWV